MRIALRNLRRHPALALTVAGVLTVALAFGIASLSILHGLLINPYPYPRLGQLLLVRDSKPREGAHQGHAVAVPDFRDARRAAPAFASLAAWRPLPLVVTSPQAEPERVEAAAVTANFFSTLGVVPMLGRTFAADADAAGHDDVVVLSRRLWNSRFGADPSAIGRRIALSNRPVTIVAIIRDEDCYPSGIDAWVPLVFSRAELADRATQNVAAFGRLRDGASAAEASAQVAALASELGARYPETNRGRGFDLLPLRREQYEFTAPLFLFVAAGALLVLVIAVVNAASLLAARTLDRRRELAIRSMLGASAAGVVGVGVSEVGILTATAGAAGSLLARVALQAVRASLPDGIARWIAGWSSLRVDAASLAAGAAISTAVAAVLAVVVAVASLRSAVNTAGGTVRVTPRSTWSRRAIVAAEIGLAAALLLAASVTVAGFARISSAYATVAPSRLLRFTLTLPDSRYPDGVRIAAFHRAMLDALRALPEVETAALMRNEPASNVPNPIVAFQRDDTARATAAEVSKADVEVVSPALFDALRLDVLSGRALSDLDGVDAPHTAVVSREAARRFWRDRDPVGTVVRLGGDPQPVRIVGVVSDFTLNWYDPAPRPTIFLPDAQALARTAAVLVRTKTDPIALARPVRAAIARLDDRQPVSGIEPLSTTIAESLSPVRVIERMLLAGAALSALLAAAGIYGVLAHWVGARRRELGVRFALGATRGSIAGLVVREAAATAAAGGAAGLAFAIVAVRVSGGALLGVPSLDARVVAIAGAAVAALAVVGSIGPARRAARVDVAELLRLE